MRKTVTLETLMQTMTEREWMEHGENAQAALDSLVADGILRETGRLNEYGHQIYQLRETPRAEAWSIAGDKIFGEN